MYSNGIFEDGHAPAKFSFYPNSFGVVEKIVWRHAFVLQFNDVFCLKKCIFDSLWRVTSYNNLEECSKAS